ncbi:MAG: glycosyltransferase [Ignavibacteriae bacterium]|nr:glycosyltransferase [Ignavibacteriota bacterium]
MSSGLPTISTFHAGIPEVIKNGENGLLINENDFIELAEKILLLINDNNLRKKLGKNASNYSRLLDVKIKTKDLVKIYKNLLS